MPGSNGRAPPMVALKLLDGRFAARRAARIGRD
jgi:hypothetical protein